MATDTDLVQQYSFYKTNANAAQIEGTPHKEADSSSRIQVAARKCKPCKQIRHTGREAAIRLRRGRRDTVDPVLYGVSQTSRSGILSRISE